MTSSENVTTLTTIIDCPHSVPTEYVKNLRDQLKQYAEIWDSSVVVKFGNQGNGLLPNYQIESSDGLKVQAFNGKSNGKRENVYNPKNLTQSFSQIDYRLFLKTIPIH